MKKGMKEDSRKKSTKEWFDAIGLAVGLTASIQAILLLIISTNQPQIVSCDDWKLVVSEYALAFVTTLLSR